MWKNKSSKKKQVGFSLTANATRPKKQKRGLVTQPHRTVHTAVDLVWGRKCWWRKGAFSARDWVGEYCFDPKRGVQTHPPTHPWGEQSGEPTFQSQFWVQKNRYIGPKKKNSPLGFPHPGGPPPVHRTLTPSCSVGSSVTISYVYTNSARECRRGWGDPCRCSSWLFFGGSASHRIHTARGEHKYWCEVVRPSRGGGDG